MAWIEGRRGLAKRRFDKIIVPGRFPDSNSLVPLTDRDAIWRVMPQNEQLDER